MPYFHRKPIDTLTGVLAPGGASIPGLPSRMVPSLGGAPDPVPAVAGAVKGATDIVQQAASVLEKMRQGDPSGSSGHAAGTQTGTAPSPGRPVSPYAPYPSSPDTAAQAGALQGRLNALIEEVVSIVSSSRADLGANPAPTPHDDAAQAVEPAPVVGPCTPTLAGTAAQVRIALCNEDSAPVQLSFLSTGLIGDSGASIGAAHIAFQPARLDLAPGAQAELIVVVQVPAQTHPGVYSGLIRASQLDYLHAVLVIQVQ